MVLVDDVIDEPGQRNRRPILLGGGRLPIASLTKMMTALLVVEREDPHDRVRITREAVTTAGSGIGVLPRGKKVQLEALQEEAETQQQQAEKLGDKLWERHPDRCCELRKVAPLRAALARYDAWITAIRRDQTRDRAHALVVEEDRKFGLVKVNPLARWSSRAVWAYIREHDVPHNRLYEQGYARIGCWPCTPLVAPGEEPRAGRWRGQPKTECGLHSLVAVNE